MKHLNSKTRIDTSRWHDIDWLECRKKVEHLQSKIVVAFKRGSMGEVKQLQHNLVKSFAARALAVRTVVTNPGKKTPGVDKVVWKTPAQKWDAVMELGNLADYKASPVCELPIVFGQDVDVHHKLAKKLGGNDTNKNLVVLHRECHKQVTYCDSALLKAGFVERGIVKEKSIQSCGKHKLDVRAV